VEFERCRVELRATPSDGYAATSLDREAKRQLHHERTRKGTKNRPHDSVNPLPQAEGVDCDCPCRKTG